MAALRRALLALALLAGGAQAAAPVAAEPPRLLRIALPADSAAALRFNGSLPVQLHLPAGPGPFPLAYVHHERRFYRGELPRYDAATQYFLARGYAVVLPLRIGYGELDDGVNRESIACPAPDPASLFRATTLQAAAVLEGLTAQGQPVDRQRVLHVGVGVGGFAALSVAAAAPQGVIGAINFGGGAGAYPERFPGEPCGSEALGRLARQLGRHSPQPTLWLYARNDLHFGPHHAKRWHREYRRSGGRSLLHLLPDWGEDGNRLFADGADRWRPLVDDYLRSIAAP